MTAGDNNAFNAKVTNHGQPKEPELKNGFFVKGWWSSDEAGNTKITEALIDDTVYFHIETRDIPNGKHIGTMLYDDDVKRATEEKDSSNGSDKIKLGPKNGNDFRYLNYREVQNNKVVINITLGGLLANMVAEEEDKTVELFFACSYGGENVELPIQFHDYLKVKEAEPLIIYVCGYWNKDMPYAGAEWGEEYWGSLMKNKAKAYFKTSKEYFINGAGTAFSSGKNRYNNGVKLTNERLKNNSSKFYKEVFKTKRNIIIISHSMGGAFSEGILEVLKREKINIEKVVHLSPADTSGFSVNYPDRTYQIDIDWDPVLMYKNVNDTYKIKGIIFSALAKNPRKDEFGHMYTKEEDFVWNWFEDLEKINFTFIKDDIKYIRHPSDGLGPATTTILKLKIFKSINTLHNSQFIRVLKDNNVYHGRGNNEYETYN